MSRSQDNLPLTNARPEQSVGGAAQDKFIIQQLISNVHTMIPVEVVSVSVPTGTLAPIGRCSVKILIQQIDGNNNVYSGGTVINVPYLRVQGGKNAVVLDPVAGDVGLCGFCERDISMVKRTGAEAAPNTRRQYSLNDAVYMFTMMSGTPEQYIHFKQDEIHIKANSKIILDAPTVEATGQILAQGIIKSLTDVMAKALGLLGFGGTYNPHTHHENGVGSDTNQPNQQVDNG